MNKTGLIITAYCDTLEKQDSLLHLVKKIKEYPETKDFYLLLATHTVPYEEVQLLCDFVLFEKENQIDKRKYSHAVAECNLISHSFNILQSLGITHTHKITFDMILDDPTIFKKWESKNTKLVLPQWFTWG